MVQGRRCLLGCGDGGRVQCWRALCSVHSSATHWGILGMSHPLFLRHLLTEGVILITRVLFSSVKRDLRPLGMISRTEVLMLDSALCLICILSTRTVVLLEMCLHPWGFYAKASMFHSICWNGWSLGFIHTLLSRALPHGSFICAIEQGTSEKYLRCLLGIWEGSWLVGMLWLFMVGGFHWCFQWGAAMGAMSIHVIWSPSNNQRSVVLERMSAGGGDSLPWCGKAHLCRNLGKQEKIMLCSAHCWEPSAWCD